MSSLKVWIVYMTPDDEIKAVECDWSDSQQVYDLHREQNIILGHPSAVRKVDAISYIEQLIS